MDKTYWLYLLLEMLKSALISMLAVLVRELAEFLQGSSGEGWQT